MSATDSELVSLFLRLAPVDGVSHAERLIADEIVSILKQSGIRVVEDDAAGRVKGNAGNLFCFPPMFDPTKPAVVLEAHLDTVQSTRQLKTIVKEDRITSDGTTILGADNRMGLTILVDMLRDTTRPGFRSCNFFVLLTVCEETGLHGAQAADLSPFDVQHVYVFDCSKRPGIYIRESVGLSAFSAQVTGKAAHAGVAPEEGVNAIALAAAAISSIHVGRIDSETTANIGKIHGGEAVNVVPDKVVVEGEVRSFRPDGVRNQLRLIESAFRQAVKEDSRLEFMAVSEFEPYVHKPDAPAVLRLERAIRSAGLIPQPIRYMGGSDANVFNARGIASVNIGIGAQKPHSKEEFFLLEDLYSASKIVRELLRP